MQKKMQLTTDFQSMEINEEVRICSFNIENVYAKMYHNMTESNPEVIKQTKSNNEQCWTKTVSNSTNIITNKQKD
jgi:hypothetical protein